MAENRLRTGPYPSNQDPNFDPTWDLRFEVPHGYKDWTEYTKEVLKANANGQPGPRPYNSRGMDMIGNPEVGPREWMQHTLTWGNLASRLDQSDPEIQQYLDNEHIQITGRDKFNFLGDQFFPALAMLGAAVGGAGAFGAFGPAAGAGAGAAEGAIGGAGAFGPAAASGASGTAGALGGAGALGAAGAGGAGILGGAGAAGGAGALGAAGGASGLLGSLGGWGPLLATGISTGGSLLGGLLASNAAKGSADTQAAAADRANQLLAAQYLQQREDLAPYRAAGYGALPQMQALAGSPLRTTPLAQQPGMTMGATPATPGTPAAAAAEFVGAGGDGVGVRLDPSQYNGMTMGDPTGLGGDTTVPAVGAQPLGYEDYRPVGALDPSQYAFNDSPYNFTAPNQALDPAAYKLASTPVLDPAAYRFAPTSGQQVLNDDPGYQFRLEQGRKALEAGAAAKGGLLSGGAQRGIAKYGQDYASQEYANAYNRALGRNEMDWQRNQYANETTYGRAKTANDTDWERAQYGNETTYNRALSENELRRGRALETNQLGYGRAYQANQDQYGRGLQTYQTNLGKDLGVRQQNWNELMALANLGLGGTNQTTNASLNYGNQAAGNVTSAGAAQAAGQVGSGAAWNQALSGAGNAVNNYLNMSLLQSLLRRR